jgi:hypothetical protein
MSEMLRNQLLLLLGKHSRSGSREYIPDTDLARVTGAALEEIRRQLEVLEAQGLIRCANAHDGYTAQIKPGGSLVVEGLEEDEVPEDLRKIGFGPDS